MLLLGIALFILLIIAHEYGHFLVAKKNGVDVEEFGLGFPPKLWGKTFGRGIFRSYYSLNLLPLGGFVRLKGEHDADTAPGSYGAASLKSKIKIMLAGVTMNLIVAVVVFTIVAWVGMPQLVENQFYVKSDSRVILSEVILNYVEENSPAEKAGLKNGDIIKTIDGKEINEEAQLRTATQESAGQMVDITYKRGGIETTANANLRTTEEIQASEKQGETKGYLGVGTSGYQLRRSSWSAPVVAIGTTGQFAWLTIKTVGGAIASLGQALFNFITGQGDMARREMAQAGENVSGPVGIVFILRQGSILGYQFILFVIGILSLTLAVMNALPIPALDGGKVTVTLLFKVLRKKLQPKTEDLIHGTGFMLLMLLFVLITVVDIGRFF